MPGFRGDEHRPGPQALERGSRARGYTIVSFANESMDIDVFGDTAIVHSRIRRSPLVGTRLSYRFE